MTRAERAAGLVLGYAADGLLGDPARRHPVAWFGTVARRLEGRVYADARGPGLVHTLTLVGAAAALGAGADRCSHGPARVAVTALATWTVLGGRSLSREALLVHGHLARDDLAAARRQVTHLVGRDPARLDPRGVTRATVESVAENTSDAVVAPLLWGALAGPAGLLGYRAANTLDAMVGHRSPTYHRFGWAAARLDDLLNLAPARLTALLVATWDARALTVWRRDAHRHPSPNAGPVEAAFAGALGLTLGGTNTYAGSEEDRGSLGDGPPPEAADIVRAVRLARRVSRGALLVAVLLSGTPRRRRRSRPGPRRPRPAAGAAPAP
ncbi:MAG: cobalamin biosynthesis protein [Nocardioidaceae bacterium]